MKEETNNISVINPNDNVYNVAKNINTILSVLTFTIICVFLYKFLKNIFRKKG